MLMILSAAIASVTPCGSSWRSVNVGGHKLTDCDAYRAGSMPTHYVCDTSDRTQEHDTTLKGCREACSADAACSVVHWQGLKENNFSATAPGQCFLLHQACFTATQYDTKLAPTFCMQTEICSREAEPAQAPTYAAISVAATMDGSVRRTVGTVRKHEDSPLLVQDKPWEPRLDNGYPNVIAPSSASGVDAWQLWYGDCISAPYPGATGCDKQVLLYANSTDGLTWDKPILNLYDIGAPHHTANNIVLYGGGLGITLDVHEPDPSRRYKGFGRACWKSGSCPLQTVEAEQEAGAATTDMPGLTSAADADIAVSADGLVWHGVASLAWPDPQRYDCHNNLFWDSRLSKYTAVTRDGFSGPVGRTIGISTSLDESFGFDTSTAPLKALYGDERRQLYSQITFPWHNTYLGIVMVYEAESADQRVRCRLAWSNAVESSEWRWVDETGEAGGLGGAEFIPLGDDAHGAFDSHVCFAAATPTPHEGFERVYYMGGNGPHSGKRNSSLGLALLRRDGYASLTGLGRVVTVPLVCTSPVLRVTVDLLPTAKNASFRVGLAGVGAADPLSIDQAMPISSNATEQEVRFAGGATFEAYVGTAVTLQLELVDAAVYTFGWGVDASPPIARAYV